MSDGPIVFDGSILGAGPPTGVARSLLHALAAYAPRAGRRCVLLVPRGSSAPELPPGLEAVAIPAARGWRTLGVARRLHELRAALLHSPVAALPPWLPCPAVATVHDLPWLTAELSGERGSGWRHRRAAAAAARRAAAVITPSAATAADLRRWLARPPRARIVTIAHGVPAPAHPADESELRGPFLAFGDRRPRKNVARVTAAHELARREDPDLPGLRWIGPGLHWVGDAEKDALLRSARAALQLSLLEGFGLPTLEAMHLGVPVVCSTRGSLPELTAGAALLVDPTDVAAMTRALIRIHRDRELRGELRARGLARAASMTPEATAEAWRALHEELV